MIKLLSAALIFGFMALPSTPSLAANDPKAEAAKLAQIATIEEQVDAAIERVAAIVNQPVTHVPRMPGSKVTVLSPGWFHGGTIKPDFNKVDIRKSRTLPYEHQAYISSNLNPTEMFIGPELEFNPMTKYFYTDYKFPKKKLSEAQMVEINQLYRIIGSGEQKLADLKKPKKSGFLSLFSKDP